MALVLNEEQRLLAETARDFLQKQAPVSALRALRDSRDPLGYDRGCGRIGPVARRQHGPESRVSAPGRSG